MGVADREEAVNRNSENTYAQHAPQRGGEAYKRDLLEIQKVDFALVELNLFLDTHPADMQALQQFNQLAQLRKQLMSSFEQKYGPQMGFGNSFSRYPWQWIDTPWPWQV